MDFSSLNSKILLEILGNLDKINLLSCRLVCKSWQLQVDAILQSSKPEISFDKMETIDKKEESCAVLPLQSSEQVQVHEEKANVIQSSTNTEEGMLKPEPEISLDKKPEILIEKTEEESSAVLSIQTSEQMEEKRANESSAQTGSVLKPEEETEKVIQVEIEGIIEQEKISEREQVSIQIDPSESEERSPRKSEESVIEMDGKSSTSTSDLSSRDADGKKEKKSFRVRFLGIKEGGNKAEVANPDYLPVPFDPEGYEGFGEFYPYYLGCHFDVRNRRLHVLGTVNALLLTVISVLTLSPLLFIAGLLVRALCVTAAHRLFQQTRALHFHHKSFTNFIYCMMGDCRLSWEVASGQRPF